MRRQSFSDGKQEAWWGLCGNTSYNEQRHKSTLIYDYYKTFSQISVFKNSSICLESRLCGTTQLSFIALGFILDGPAVELGAISNNAADNSQLINTSKPYKSTPHFIALCFIVLSRYCIFYTLKVCVNPASSKAIGAIFSIACAHFLSLCHILVILGMFQTLSLLYLWYYIWWSAISDLWCYNYNCFEALRTMPT